MTSNPVLYPNVSSVPRTEVDSANRERGGSQAAPGEFSDALNQAMVRTSGTQAVPVREPLKFSAHALQRLKDRKIALDQGTLGRVNTAVDKAAAKGVQDTLVLTNDAALIVNVKNRTVVTAMDRGALDGNVFTNIDGAVIV